MYKLKIFISSKVDEDGENKFSYLRKQIKSKLESLELFNVYIFEKAHGSSKNVVDDYLDEITDSHICLFLINTAEKVPDGVQKEINLARKLKKPKIYIINRENAKKEIPLEKELKKPENSKIKIIYDFNEFFDQSIESIKSEIVKIYKDYSMGRLARFQDDESLSKEKQITFTEIITEKIYIEGFKKTQEHICDFMGTDLVTYKELTSNNLDNYMLSFFDVLIGNKDIKEFNTTLFLEELKNWHKSAVYEVVEIRWKAILYYYLGNLNKCLEYLNVAYETAKSNNLPSWLIQDILIDLRNKNALINRNKNIIELKSPYQEKLNEYDEVLTYPVIDRLRYDLNQRIEKKRKDLKYKKPHSVTYDNILSEYAGMITSIYVVAAYYGSLTHLELIIGKMQMIYFHLVELYSDWEFKLKLLKLTAYLNNSKDMERILRTYNSIYSKIDSKDVEEIIVFVSSHPDKITVRKNQLLVLEHFGYYLNDEVYDKYTKQIMLDLEEWINDSDRNVYLGDYYFNFINNNIERLDHKEVVRFSNSIFSMNLGRLYKIVLQILSKVNFNEILKDDVDELLSNIRQLVNERKIDLYDRLRIVLSIIYQSTANNEAKDIVFRFPKFERELFLTEIYKDDINQLNEMFLLIISKLNIIYEQAKTSSIFSVYGYNYFKIIKDILIINDELPDESKRKLYKILSKTVINENQDSESKIDALQLMVYLKNNDLKFPNNNYFRDLFTNSYKVLNVRESLFYNYSSLVINFNYYLFKSLFQFEKPDYQFITELNNANVEERLGFSVAIKNYLDGNKFSVDPLIIHILFLLKSDENEQVRVNCLQGFLNYLSNHHDENILLEISKMMNKETSLLKNVILRNYDIVKEKDPEIAQYIVQKGRLDNHYIIRSQAEKITHFEKQKIIPKKYS